MRRDPKYSTTVFIDSMVVLEAHPLPALPWKEIDSDGPILILVVPQVLKEIDNRKRDGRVGKRARAFNRLIDAAIETNAPCRIVDGTPSVYLGVAVCKKIDWNNLSDLDSDEPDARVVAEAIAAKNASSVRRLFWSNDLNPRAMAIRNGLEAPRMPEHWMLGPEPSPQDKEIKRLSVRIKELETTSPAINFKLEFVDSKDVSIFQVQGLTPEERNSFEAAVLAINPCPTQTKRSNFDYYDHTLIERYNKYVDSVVPDYVANLPHRVQRLYSQVAFEFRIENVGAIQAENLVIQMRAEGGTLHDKLFYPAIHLPSAPQPKSSVERFDLLRHLRNDLRVPSIGRHDINYLEEPDHNAEISFSCIDFRQGGSWTFSGVATVNTETPSPFNIEVMVTASNLRGALKEKIPFEFEVRTVRVEDLMNVFRREHKIRYPLQSRVEAVLDDEILEAIEFEEIDRA